MRQIGWRPIAVFFALFSLAGALGIYSALWLDRWTSLGDFRGMVLSAAAIVFVYLYAIAIYRSFLGIVHWPEGEVEAGTSLEFVRDVHLFFYLILFNSVIRSGFLPVPLMRLFHIALGASIGKSTYISGIVYDHLFVHIGADTIVGEGSLLSPHAIEGQQLAYRAIRIGSNVTISAHAIVLAGVTIEDDAIVAAGAVVLKGTRIRKGEMWGGVPARCLVRRS